MLMPFRWKLHVSFEGCITMLLCPIPVSGDNAAGIQPTNHYHSISIRRKFQSWFHGHLIGAPGTPNIWWPSQKGMGLNNSGI